MAKINKAALNKAIQNHDTQVKVGHNRTVILLTDAFGETRIVCRLHGHAIVTIRRKPGSWQALVDLDTCGYLTTTTISAMNDFLKAFDIAATASCAGGVLTARSSVNGEWRDRTNLTPGSVMVARIPADLVN
jgi:hypothetical protein